MADSTIKPDDGNDLVLQNNHGDSKIEVNEDDTVNVTSGGNFTVDATGDIILDADGADVTLKDGGTTFGILKQSSGHLVLQPTSSKEIVLNDEGGDTSLTIDTDGNVEIAQNIEQANGKNIQTDEIRARDSGGLKLYDDSGSAGIFVQDEGGNAYSKIGINSASPSAIFHIQGAGGTDNFIQLHPTNINDAIRIYARTYGLIKFSSAGNIGEYVFACTGVGINTDAPSQILDCNDGGGNMIADGYDTHSLSVYKENIEDASGFLAKVSACSPKKWNPKPFISADEIKEAVLEEFGETVWKEYFPEEDSHRQKALYNMPEGELKTWIDEWCEAKRAQMRPLAKWQKKKLGLVADAEITAEYLPEVISKNDKGEPVGIDTMTYIGILHSAIQELSVKVTALENA